MQVHAEVGHELSPDQRGVLRGSGLALALSAGVISAGYAWLPAELFGLEQAMTPADRIAFALRANLFLFVWLARCVGAVSRGRFLSSADIRSSAFGPVSLAINVRVAVLQNINRAGAARPWTRCPPSEYTSGLPWLTRTKQPPGCSHPGGLHHLATTNAFASRGEVAARGSRQPFTRP